MTTNEFILPDLGEGLTEAAIVSWLVAEGDRVEIDQPVVELESAKSVVELPVPFSGTITKLCGDVGDVMHAGKPLLSVSDAAEADGTAAGPTAGPAAATLDEPVAGAAVDSGSGAVLVGYGTTEPERRTNRGGARRFAGRHAAHLDASAATTAPAASPVAAAGSADGAPRRSPVVSPIVRKLARDHGLDASELIGTGRGGLVVRGDVEAAIAASSASAAAPTETATTSTTAPALTTPAAAGTTAAEQRIPLTGVKKFAAEHFVRSRTTIPEVTIWLDVDATELLAAKTRIRAVTGEKLGLTALVARFALAGLRRFPILNSSVDDEAGEIVVHGDVNLGIAAQTARGLMVPVVHGASGLTTRELQTEIGAIASASAEGAFPPERLRGGTFTVNNYGGFGVDGSTPIINHPEVAMLGIGRLKERPWVVNGELAVRTVLTLTLTFDHRVCDGEVASQFLTSVASNVEEPLTLLAGL